MNIKRAKQEIKNAIAAYLQKDESGEYFIPSIRQRPILLMGPPGIGKTQIMEQVAGECDLGLVAYTITHHTRQSAIGLPFIREKEYDGALKSVTEYTMSEIIASVYDRMEESGKKEGILFIDEINCVSETLAPTMLQFLQGKSFGNQKVPEGWVIVAAGNPPEYNKSVRDFDVVTLDRVKVINVEPDFPIWKEFAYEVGLHGSVISYLDIHKENFYRMETTVDGKQFVTARGWQDLSEVIYAYERLGLTMDREVVIQYLQHPKTAKDFANYLELYYRYKTDYQIDEILSGTIRPGALNKLKFAPFDERVKVVSLILARLAENFRKAHDADAKVSHLFGALKAVRAKFFDAAGDQESCGVDTYIQIVEEALASENEAFRSRVAAGQNERELKNVFGGVIRELEADVNALRSAAGEIGNAAMTPDEAFTHLQERFAQVRENMEKVVEQASAQLEYAFDFMEAAFGEGQEMVVFITELSVNPYAVAFLRENDCDRYYMYNKTLLFADREANVRAQLDQIREMQIT